MQALLPPLRFGSGPQSTTRKHTGVAGAAAGSVSAAGERISLSTRRPLTVNEDETVDAAFEYTDGSETEVYKLRAGAGERTVATLGKHMPLFRRRLTLDTLRNAVE